ncbi:MAG: DUF4198 domain-containing protein [Planctomycetota bacterium]
MSAYKTNFAFLAMVVIASGAVAAAASVPVSYLTPDSFSAATGAQVKLHVESGSALSTQMQAWPDDKLQWFFTRANGTQQNRDTVKALEPQGREVAVTITQPGVTVIGYDSKPLVTNVAPAEFQAFLSKNVSTGALKAGSRDGGPDRIVQVRRVESATTMIRVSADGVGAYSSATALSKTGQAVEIRPLFDPTLVKPGSDLPVRVYVGGSKKAGAKVQATSVNGNQTVSVLADPTGVANFRIDQAGTWRIEFHHAEALAGDPAAEWSLYSATLTFEVGSEGAQK